jgi:hypothetical protein
MRWAGHVASMEEIKMHRTLWSENLEGRDYFEALGIDGIKTDIKD